MGIQILSIYSSEFEDLHSVVGEAVVEVAEYEEVVRVGHGLVGSHDSGHETGGKADR